jgi:hypothetical protein
MFTEAVCSILNNRLLRSTIQNCIVTDFLIHSYCNNKNTILDLALINTFFKKIYFVLDMLKSIIENMSSDFYYHHKCFKTIG